MYRWPDWAGSEQTRETTLITPQPIRPIPAEWAVQSQSSNLIITPVCSEGVNNTQNDFGDIEVINSLFTDGMDPDTMRANNPEALCHHACHLHRHTAACGRSPPVCYPLLNSLLPRTYLNGVTSEQYNSLLSMGLDGNRGNGNIAVNSSSAKDKKIIPSPIVGNTQTVHSTGNNEMTTDNLGNKNGDTKSNHGSNNKWKEKHVSVLKPGPAITKKTGSKKANSSGSGNSRTGKLNGVQILEIAQKLGQIPGLESIRWESLLDSSRKQDVSDKEISTRVQEAEILGSRLFGGDLEKLLSSLLSQHLDFLVYFVRMSLSGDTSELKDVREMLWRTLTAVRDREEAEGEHSD